MLYSWKPEDALNMPASRFFAMLKAGREVSEAKRALHISDLCDVSSIALGDSKYYMSVKNQYRDRLQSIADDKQGQNQEPAPKPAALDAGSTDASRAIRHIFSNAKRFS